jgi:hypothetical protein
MCPSVAGKPHDKYSINAGGVASHYGWAHTLVGAKKVGEKIAKLEAWRGKWNLLFISVNISVGGPAYYKPTGWRMYVPVRGSGKSADYIVAAIKRRHGVAPLKWTKK